MQCTHEQGKNHVTLVPAIAPTVFPIFGRLSSVRTPSPPTAGPQENGPALKSINAHLEQKRLITTHQESISEADSDLRTEPTYLFQSMCQWYTQDKHQLNPLILALFPKSVSDHPYHATSTIGKEPVRNGWKEL